MDIGKFQKFLERKTRHREDDHVDFDWNQIDEDIYIGTNVCCQIHFDKHLLSLGITGNVSMEAERIDNPKGVAAYLWLPTIDHAAPSQDKLMIGVKSIESMIKEGHKVYIHCKNGHGRGPTMGAAYYIYKGMSVQEAVDYIKERRSESHIEKVQSEALEEFEKKVNSKMD